MQEEKNLNIEEMQSENQTERQFFYMSLCRQWVTQKSKEIGRPLTACVNTFGCQMNFVTMIMKKLILRHFLKKQPDNSLRKVSVLSGCFLFFVFINKFMN